MGECKWGAKRAGRRILTDLVAKTAEIVPKQGQWRIIYLGFARGGWSAAAKEYAKELSKGTESGDNWHVAGGRLLDLEQVDADLARWTA